MGGGGKIKGCVRVSKPRKKKNYYSQYRSSIVSLLKLFTELPLKEKHIKALERTLFCYLFQGLIYNKMESIAFKKRDDDVVRIIQSFDSKLKLFKLGNKPVMLRESDITLILGFYQGRKH
ncbi:hypothetical protein L1049_012456 [Liquidambar formosana]|uniref:Uncharacterized protein n=1 Tax=Liquidambar formosana TaxID=63359 RepID=A0AAP0N560_LIQFO